MMIAILLAAAVLAGPNPLSVPSEKKSYKSIFVHVHALSDLFVFGRSKFANFTTYIASLASRKGSYSYCSVG